MLSDNDMNRVWGDDYLPPPYSQPMFGFRKEACHWHYRNERSYPETGVYIIDQIGIPNRGEDREPIGNRHGKGVREPAADLSEEFPDSVLLSC